MRDLCERCKKNPKAINYKKAERIYYRRLCDSCVIKQKKDTKPQWQVSGYKKKFKCEACGFIPKIAEQLTVYDNNGYKTVCLNCDVLARTTNQLEIKKELKSDF